VTKEAFLKDLLERVEEFTELTGDDLMWIGSKLISEGLLADDR
jgi:hypothetical protein